MVAEWVLSPQSANTDTAADPETPPLRPGVPTRPCLCGEIHCKVDCPRPEIRDPDIQSRKCWEDMEREEAGEEPTKSQKKNQSGKKKWSERKVECAAQEAVKAAEEAVKLFQMSKHQWKRVGVRPRSRPLRKPRLIRRTSPVVAKANGRLRLHITNPSITPIIAFLPKPAVGRR